MIANLAGYCLANVLGVFISFRINRYERQQFLTLLREQEASKALAERTVELEQTVAEKTTAFERIELLMREMNHRVKNNLNIIQSLLNLQSDRIGDDHSKHALKDSVSRVQSITKIHNMLTKSADLKHIYASDYIRQFVEELSSSFQSEVRQIEIDLDLDEIDMDMNLMIPFALIMNELLTNAFKYAFPDQREGAITVSLHSLENYLLEFIVRDNGVGLPEGFTLEGSTSLGLNIINSLTEQIRGKIDFISERNKGTTFSITFKNEVEQNEN